ncbi:MAG: hypothetical protein JXA74_05165 [Anaerolineae bacterium]|nr:hypothetical protein [Anaerolineae bacterium]
MASSGQRIRRILILVLLLLNVVLVVLPWAVRRLSRAAYGLGYSAETGLTRYLVQVHTQGLEPYEVLTPRPFAGRFTTMAMQEARAPESARLDLQPYQGALVVIEGRDAGGWVYSAAVVQRIDQPLLALALQYAWLLSP